MKTRDELIDELIDLAFAEDIGDGDATTLSCIPENEQGRSRLIVKEEGTLAGVEMAKRVFNKFDPSLKMTTYITDGAHVKPGDIAFVVEGKVQSLLQTGEVDAQYHATHEWYCHYYGQIPKRTSRIENKGARHQKDHTRNAHS